MPDEADLMREIVDGHVNKHRSMFEYNVKRMAALCESPIERVMMAALIDLTLDMGNCRCWWSSTPERFGTESTFPDWHGYAQVKAEGYRLDIGISVPTNSRNLLFAIECDGHDFHERTKEQAARDKQRDRVLQLAGIRIIRFTGSEIWADAEGCAAQVVEIIESAFLDAAA